MYNNPLNNENTNNNNLNKNNDLFIKFEKLIKDITDITQNIYNIVSKENFDNNIDLEIVKNEYIKRDKNIKLLNNIFITTEGTKLIVSDIWNKFMQEVVPIELKNREILKEKGITIIK